MSTVYKKFTPQDYAIVPFNAHKQYNFVSEKRKSSYSIRSRSCSCSRRSGRSSRSCRRRSRSRRSCIRR